MEPGFENKATIAIEVWFDCRWLANSILIAEFKTSILFVLGSVGGAAGGSEEAKSHSSSSFEGTAAGAGAGVDGFCPLLTGVGDEEDWARLSRDDGMPADGCGEAVREVDMSAANGSWCTGCACAGVGTCAGAGAGVVDFDGGETKLLIVEKTS